MEKIAPYNAVVRRVGSASISTYLDKEQSKEYEESQRERKA